MFEVFYYILAVFLFVVAYIGAMTRAVGDVEECNMTLKYPTLTVLFYPLLAIPHMITAVVDMIFFIIEYLFVDGYVKCPIIDEWRYPKKTHELPHNGLGYIVFLFYWLYYLIIGDIVSVVFNYPESWFDFVFLIGGVFLFFVFQFMMCVGLTKELGFIYTDDYKERILNL